ncbi:MAG: protein kinase [Deltaproteobacteria bacterium]|nr:protein kinase [Deltaproteobacteria bacterium]
MIENSFDSDFMTSLGTIKKVGRYELLKKLGRGGAGVVYLGRDPYIKRLVAIKISQTDTDKSRERFLVEAQSAGRFHHPNIVDIHDVGVQDDFCYLTMEYIEGSTLEKYCQEPDLLAKNKVVEILLDVCSALDYSHKKGVIHRDIKPANIMLTKSGYTKIADFGVAQMTEKTAETGIIGTPSYMSPEQLKGDPVGCESDIFSVGCVLYELLVGRQAFQGDNNFSIMYKITNDEPEPMSIVRNDIPPILEEILKKALAKDPKERYRSCMELAFDLRVALRGLTDKVNESKIRHIVDYVNHLAFFNNFDEDQVKEVVSVSNIVKVLKGRHILSEGEINDTFYIVMSGRVKVRKGEKDIAVIGTGSCFGEMALIAGQTRSANVIADTDCILLKLSAFSLDTASETVKYLFYKNFAMMLVRRLAN